MITTINQRITPEGNVEGRFRREVRDALDLDIFTRDDMIISEIKRLKKLATAPRVTLVER